MQIVIAGKAHPKDQPGKSYIREIVQLSRDPDLWKHVVFVEDYDMKVAREMVQGVDLWLNNPRRGEEACGTSGMKAGHQRRAQPEHSGRLVRRSLRNLRRLGHRRPRALFRRSGRAARQRHLLPAGKRNRADVLRAPRTDAARVDAAREAVADVHQPAVRLPAHGARIHDASFTTRRTRSTCALRAERLSAQVREKARWNARIREVWDRVRFVEAGAGAGAAR